LAHLGDEDARAAALALLEGVCSALHRHDRLVRLAVLAAVRTYSERGNRLAPLPAWCDTGGATLDVAEERDKQCCNAKSQSRRRLSPQNATARNRLCLT
jgi:hypothetical protein